MELHRYYYYNPETGHNPVLYEEVVNRYPILRWINGHTKLLVRLNLLFVFLYIAFFFTRVSKKWHIKAEE